MSREALPSTRAKSAPFSNGSGKTIQASIRSSPERTQSDSCSHGAVSPCRDRLDTARRLQFAWSPQRPSRFRAGVLTVFQDLRAVHEYVLHAECELVRLHETRTVANRRRIEYDHVGEHSFLQEPAMIEAEICYR